MGVRFLRTTAGPSKKLLPKTASELLIGALVVVFALLLLRGPAQGQATSQERELARIQLEAGRSTWKV